MPYLLPIFTVLTLLTVQGCQFMPTKRALSNVSTQEQNQDKILSLLRQGNRYSNLSTKEQQAVCKRLTLDYHQHEDWQTAWLLIYSLNNNFKCVNLNKTIALLKSIQTDITVNPSLQWMNIQQLKLLHKHQSLQLRNNKYLRKNSHLKTQLNEAEIQLQNVISKIQALKVIETTINQKTQ